MTPTSAGAARPADTMTVTVLDRAAMNATWGRGPSQIILVTGEIATICPTCGGPRGAVRGLNAVEDGEHYHVTMWDNTCGHLDMYEAVVREIRARRAATTDSGAPR